MVPEKPIFMQDWWMDAVCAGKAWQQILPDMPCLIRKRWWMRWICMPQQTQIGGMWLNPQTCTISDAQAKALQIDAKLRDMKLDYYYQQYPIGSPLPQEMKQLGYKVKERVTYRIEDLSDLDKVIDNFSKNKKRQLQKALSLHAERGMHVEDFYAFHAKCMAEKKHQISYSREFLLVLDRKLKRLGQGDILSICDADGNVLAAAYLVWDKESMYYLIPCYKAEYKDSGAGALLVLEAIKMARELGLKFDFCQENGSAFSGVRTSYFSVFRSFNWLTKIVEILPYLIR